jgi:mono/diheme cytochrome c family protein
MSARSAAHSSPEAPAPRRRRGVWRLTLHLAAGAGLLLVAAVAGTFAVAEKRARTHYDVPSHVIHVATDSETVARGARLAQVRFCADCHATGLVGKVLAEDPALGRIAPPNLTAGRALGALTDTEWERAVRHGVRADGSPLLIMPAHEFTQITDDDLAAIVAYARQLPASTATLAPTEIGPLIKVLDVAGQVEVYPASLIDHNKPHLSHLAPEPTAAYGKYMASTCTGCHGTGLSGGKIPGTPPDWPAAANITPTGIGHYSLADLTRLLRTGIRPDGSHVNDGMPWKFTQSLDDTEIAAIYAYLKTVPPSEYGKR